MAARDDKELLDKGLDALVSDEVTEDQEALFEHLADRIEEPGLQDRILQRYMQYGRQMLGDALPSHVDPRIAKRLEPLLGDVTDVRVHTGAVATAAARAMEARAFAIGDRDIFVDRAQFDPGGDQGGALLAHEIAHTRDAATGFALSAKHGTHTSAREEFAHEVEHRFARELEEDGEPMVADKQEATKENQGKDPVAKLNRADLAERVAKVLKKQNKAHGERTGRW